MPVTASVSVAVGLDKGQLLLFLLVGLNGKLLGLCWLVGFEYKNALCSFCVGNLLIQAN